MATVNLGRIKPIWQGTWNSSTQYIADDIVYYNNSAWIAVATSTNSAPADGNANWDKMSQGLSANSVTATELADGAVTAAKIASGAVNDKVKQIKTYVNTTRVTKTDGGDYLNWGSFTKIGGAETSLHVFGTIWGHQRYGNNIGNPAIRYGNTYNYHGWARDFHGTSDFQTGYTFNMVFSGLSPQTNNFYFWVPSEGHRWQAVLNPNNSDNGISNRLDNGSASVLTVMEVEV